MLRLSKNALVFLLTLGLSSQTQGNTQKPHHQLALDEITGLITQFYSESEALHEAWARSYERLKKQLSSGPSNDAFVLMLNSELVRIGFGNPSVITPTDDHYWWDEKMSPSENSGILHRRRGKHWYASRILPQGAAAQAGLMRGDQLLAVGQDSYRPYQPMPSSSDQKRHFKIKRDPIEGEKILPWQPGRNGPPSSLQEQVAQLILSDSKTYEVGAKKIAYLPLPSLDAALLPSTRRSLLDLQNRKPDRWIIDLRSGFPGRSAGFLDLFGLTDRKANGQHPDASQLREPIVLINRKSIQGQEWLAWLLQKHSNALLVGEPSSGSILESRSFKLQSADWKLWMPIPDPQNDVGLSQGRRLKPDLMVRDTLVFSRGQDSLLEAALQLAVQKD